jgi:glucose/arabinose dehydrogenase
MPMTWRRLYYLFLLLAASCQNKPVTTAITAVPEVGTTQVVAASPGSAVLTATGVSATSVPNQPTTPATRVPATATSLPSPTLTAAPSATPTVPASVIEVAGASLPPGFSILNYADIFRPTSLSTYGEGQILATSQDGTIHLFTDENGDGRADVDSVFAYGFLIPLGITLGSDGETVYVSSNSRISTLKDTDSDMVADEIANFVQGLPVGLHQNDNLKFGPDGMIYMGVGSTCNACVEADQRSATLMRFNPATGKGEVYATGLRNPFDLAFHPVTGDLFATDNGRDDLGMDAPHEELNLIHQGADYGWPNCWDNGLGSGCDGTELAVAFFEPHGSANSIDFYTGDRFPADYGTNADRATAFVTVLGSWIKPGVETGVARVWLWPEGESYRSEVSWFAQWPGGMPLGLIVGMDGALYVGDYINDTIYRISYGP